MKPMNQEKLINSGKGNFGHVFVTYPFARLHTACHIHTDTLQTVRDITIFECHSDLKRVSNELISTNSINAERCFGMK